MHSTDTQAHSMMSLDSRLQMWAKHGSNVFCFPKKMHTVYINNKNVTYIYNINTIYADVSCREDKRGKKCVPPQ